MPDLNELREAAILERLERAKAKANLKQVYWPDGYLVGKDGTPVRFHKAQQLAWDSTRRTVALIGGSQLGKTAFSPWFLKREIERCGQGDYLAVTSSFDLFKLKLLPQVLLVFEEILKWGRFWVGDKVFELKDPRTGKYWATKATDQMWGRIILRSAQALGGLESATANAAILDEAGQDEFTVEARRAIRRRLTLRRGRELITTTLYNLGWVKSDLIDKANKGGVVVDNTEENGAEIEYVDNAEADIAVIHADSIINPEFPISEFKEAQDTLPPDVFAMFYKGRVARPRHMIYDCLDEDIHIIPRFEIPADWQRYLGLDFGAVNTIAVFIAEEPTTQKLFIYRSYKHGGRSAKEHVDSMMEGEPMLPRCWGGAQAEGQWRQEFRDGGLSVQQPKIADVWLGINRVYALIKNNEVFIFDDLADVLNDMLTYHRKYDNQGNPTDEIYQKNSYHFADAIRYVLSSIKRLRVALIAFA